MRKPALAVIVAASMICFSLSQVNAQDKEAKDEGKWTTIKGRIVLPKGEDIPKMAELTPQMDKEACLAKGKYYDETFEVDAKTRGVKNVVVWIEPKDSKRAAPFPQNIIHPKLAKPVGNVEIDQPCCKFIPHVLAAREGQTLTIKNSAPVPHNANWKSENNGEVNPLIPSKGEYVIKDLKAERTQISLTCTIHREMKAWVRVYDHPYFAVTDENGNFEIKLAPQGEFKVYVWKETFSGGRDGAVNGIPVKIAGATMDMKEVDFKRPK